MGKLKLYNRNIYERLSNKFSITYSKLKSYFKINPLNFKKMKLKKIFILTIAIISLNLNAFSQEEQVEAPMFGAKRNFNYAYVHDFKTVNRKASSFQFTIKNDGKAAMHIVDVDIPAKVGITIVERVISPGKKAVIIATVDPTIAPKGKLQETITVTTKQKGAGVTTTKEIKFLVKAEVK